MTESSGIPFRKQILGIIRMQVKSLLMMLLAGIFLVSASAAAQDRPVNKTKKTAVAKTQAGAKTAEAKKGGAEKGEAKAAGTRKETHEGFDPSRDAEKDIQLAIQKAQASGRKILIDVGGQWCVWCRMLDQFFRDNNDASELLSKNFEVVKVNYSPENKNEKVLSRYPKVAGYPHIFILDKDGNLLHSQNTAELEQGRGYSKEKIMEFLERYK